MQRARRVVPSVWPPRVAALSACRFCGERMRKGSLVVVLVSARGCHDAHADSATSRQQVQDWWKAKSSEDLTIEGPLQEVHLMDKEVAFVAPVGFYERGPNFIWRSVLVRPALQEVRELPAPIGGREV